MPVVFIDIGLFAFLMVAVLAVGLAIGWLLSRLRKAPSTDDQTPADTRLFLQLMSRADHALDNYITSIQGHMSVLGDDLPTDPQRWQVSRDAIIQAASQMRRHVERLRLIRVGLDETSIRVAPVNLARLMESILISLEPAATENDVALRMEVQQLPHAVPGDPQILEEIFTTLLDNAITHNPPGTEVVAELTRQDQMALARISDTGKGMSEEFVARIFEAGARDRSAGTAQGTGMGLYIARMLTELHGGTIAVESRPEKGSQFSVALPLRRSES